MLEQVRLAMRQLKVTDSQRLLAELEEQMLATDFWHDKANAEAISSQASSLRKHVESWTMLEADLATTLELAEMSDSDQETEFRHTLAGLTSRYDAAMIELKLSGEFDAGPAIVQITAGAGGTDAQDWAQMLLHMYSKYCDKSGLRHSRVDGSYGEEAGIKSATLEVA